MFLLRSVFYSADSAVVQVQFVSTLSVFFLLPAPFKEKNVSQTRLWVATIYDPDLAVRIQ